MFQGDEAILWWSLTIAYKDVCLSGGHEVPSDETVCQKKLQVNPYWSNITLYWQVKIASGSFWLNGNGIDNSIAVGTIHYYNVVHRLRHRSDFWSCLNNRNDHQAVSTRLMTTFSNFGNDDHYSGVRV